MNTNDLFSINYDTCGNETEWRKQLSLIFRHLFYEKHVSQNVLSYTTSISPATMSGYVTGKAIPNLYYANLIMHCFDEPLVKYMDRYEWSKNFVLIFNNLLRTKQATQQTLSQVTQINHTTLNRYVNGHHVPGLYDAAKIAHCLGYPLLVFRIT